MSDEELAARFARYRDDHHLVGNVDSPLFGAVSVSIYMRDEFIGRDHARFEPSARSLQIVRDFLALTPEDFAAIRAQVWADYEECCEDVSYGFDIPEGMDEAQANRVGFEVHTPEQAMAKSHLMRLQVDEDDEKYPNNYGQLKFDNSWSGHLCVVVMKNGRIVGRGEDGLYIGHFEEAD